MLIEKPTVALNDIIAIKLINGAEIVGTLYAENRAAKSFTVCHPLLLVDSSTGGGQSHVAFAPFMLGLDDHDKITIENDKMMVRPIKARPQLAAQYLQALP